MSMRSANRLYFRDWTDLWCWKDVMGGFGGVFRAVVTWRGHVRGMENQGGGACNS